MNNDFFNGDKYYLVNIFNGEVKKNLINFSIINNTKYNLLNSKEISIASKTKEIDTITGEELFVETEHQGFLKSSVDSYKDDLDIINSEIAELLDFSSSQVYRVETNTNLFGIVNIVIKEKYEQQINMDVLINRLIRLIKEKNVTLTSWLKDYFSLPKTSQNLLLNSEKDVTSVIEMTINSLSILFRLNSEEQEKLRKDYIKMIFFDLLSNNRDRSFNRYSILINNDAKFCRLAPIYEYNNDIEANSYYILNNVYIDKNAVLSTLFHKYYAYFKQVSKGITANYGLYLESINLIIDNNINGIYAKQIKENFKSNIDTIKSLELIHSRNYSENKLDFAMTQTSINLNALNKNQMVHSKYKTKNKNNAVKVEDIDDVKIKVEPKKEDNKVKNIALIIFGILLLIGIIIGIVFIVLSIFK